MEEVSVELFQGDFLDISKNIPDKSIDVIITDIPYGTVRCTWDVIIPLDLMWKNSRRICKENFITTSRNPFASILICSNLKEFKYDWVWNKKSPTGYLNSKKRPMIQHELIAVFSFGKGKYYPQIRNNVTVPFGKTGKRNNSVYGNAGNNIKQGVGYPLSILEYPKPNNLSGGGLHPTQKPLALYEYLVKTYSKEGDTILDFCMGSGTTGVACKKNKRNFVGIEKDFNYFEIAKKRIFEAE